MATRSTLRRLLPVVALVVLVGLSGCNYDTTKDVRPVVESVEPAGDGAYSLDLRVGTDYPGTDDEVGPVGVYGYSLDGDLVCTARFPDITERRRATTTCQGFPSVLVSDTPNRDRTVRVGGPLGQRQVEITPIAKLYVGQNGSVHRFERIEGDPVEARGFALRDGRPVPDASVRQTLKCRQWKRDRRGAAFDVLGAAPWLDWERRPPDTTRLYEVRVENDTHLAALNRTDSLGPNRTTAPYTGDEVPDPLVRLIADNRNSTWGFGTRISEDTFYGLVSELSGRRVETTAGLPAAMEQVRGAAGSYDNTGIDCRANPPRYRQNRDGSNLDRGRYVKLFVVQNGTRWAVDIRTRQEYAGPAFVNVTAPGATPTPAAGRDRLR